MEGALYQEKPSTCVRIFPTSIFHVLLFGTEGAAPVTLEKQCPYQQPNVIEYQIAPFNFHVKSHESSSACRTSFTFF